MATGEDRLLTIQEVAERWQRSPKTIRRYIAAGYLTAVVLNPGAERKTTRVRLSEVEARERAQQEGQ